MGACAVAAVKLVTAACLIAGDSIALGLHHAMPECAVDAQNCVPSANIIGRIHPAYATIIVSAGSNDARNKRLPANLEAIRARAPRARFIWIVPALAGARDAIDAVARRHGDAAVTFLAGRDGVHPSSNGALARAVRARRGGG